MTLDSTQLPARCPDPDCGIEVGVGAAHCPACGRTMGAPGEREVVWRPPATRGMKVVAWMLLAVMLLCMLVGVVALIRGG